MNKELLVRHKHEEGNVQRAEGSQNHSKSSPQEPQVPEARRKAAARRMCPWWKRIRSGSTEQTGRTSVHGPWWDALRELADVRPPLIILDQS